VRALAACSASLPHAPLPAPPRARAHRCRRCVAGLQSEELQTLAGGGSLEEALKSSEAALADSEAAHAKSKEALAMSESAFAKSDAALSESTSKIKELNERLAAEGSKSNAGAAQIVDMQQELVAHEAEIVKLESDNKALKGTMEEQAATAGKYKQDTSAGRRRAPPLAAPPRRCESACSPLPRRALARCPGCSSLDQEDHRASRDGQTGERDAARARQVARARV